VWFHIAGGPYQEEHLKQALSEEGDTGSAELHLDEDGTLTCYLTVKWNVEVYEPSEMETTVGVDIGETVIYAATVVANDGVEQVKVKPEREFRHYRERLDEKRERLMEQGDLRGVGQCRGERERYTEQVLDTASREIVDFAVEHRPTVIALETLTDYRKTAEDPIHDWPYAQLQEKIIYKATEEGIPVTMIEPRNTSVTCRKCGQTNPEFRDGTEFKCTQCGYEVHADVNAAINIANGGVKCG
jgi:IS605 OrfB family transposase